MVSHERLGVWRMQAKRPLKSYAFDYIFRSIDYGRRWIFIFIHATTSSIYMEHWRRRIRYYRRFWITHEFAIKICCSCKPEWKRLSNNTAWCNRIQLAAASKNNLNRGNIPSGLDSHFPHFVIAIDFENRRASAVTWHDILFLSLSNPPFIQGTFLKISREKI